MLKKGVFIIAFVLLAQFGWSQSDLTVQGTSPELYLTHTVQPKETWYAIGRIYNASPKEIAALSNMKMDKVLVGQQLKVPLTAANFTQNGTKKPDEVFVPVYHIVAEKEWMYRISQNHNKIPIETLEKWNNITNDQLRPGMKLIVGYLKVKTASPLAVNGLKKIVPAVAPATNTVAKNDKAAEAKEEIKKEEPKKEDAKKDDLKKEDAKKDDIKEAKKEELKKEEPKDDAKKEIASPAAEEAKTSSKTAVVQTSSTDDGTYTGYKGGYFKSMYNGTGKSTAGNAGVFRSTSGWKDGKYYALMNNVPVGTIVKVTNSSTNKSVFAKVLGQLPDMKESVGLTIRLSDAAAAELGSDLGKFYVDVAY
jgi:LysM repeat protein